MQQPTPPPRPHWKDRLGKKEKIIASLIGLGLLLLLWLSYVPPFPDSLPHAGLTAEQEGPMREQKEFFKLLNRSLRAHHGYLVITEESSQPNQNEEGPRKFRQVYTKIDETLLFQTLQNQAGERDLTLKMQRSTGKQVLYQAIFIKDAKAWVQLKIQLDETIKGDHASKLVNPLMKEEPDPGAVPSEEGLAKLVIIVDDIGQNLKLFKKFVQLHPNLTFSILPHLPYSRPAAALAEELGLEVMLHLPMQPMGWPEINPGPGALLMDHDSDELLDQLELDFEEVPQAIGVNNHMGSALVQNEAAMHQVMGSLARRGVFFLDSKTASGAVAENAAQEAGVPFLSRDVFLDDAPGAEQIRIQLQKAIEIARERGQAIAICHPRPETWKILQQELHLLQNSGVTLVRVSQLFAQPDPAR